MCSLHTTPARAGWDKVWATIWDKKVVTAIESIFLMSLLANLGVVLLLHRVWQCSLLKMCWISIDGFFGVQEHQDFKCPVCGTSETSSRRQVETKLLFQCCQFSLWCLWVSHGSLSVRQVWLEIQLLCIFGMESISILLERQKECIHGRLPHLVMVNQGCWDTLLEVSEQEKYIYVICMASGSAGCLSECVQGMHF